MENLSDFDFYLKFTKPLILNLPAIDDRILAAAWVKKLAKDAGAEENVRLDYLKLLLFVLQRKKLAPPFTQHPNALETLEKFPENQTLVDVAKNIIEKENLERKRVKGEGDYPPYISDFSGDLLEYVAVQTIDDFGVHAYYAVSKTPLSSWFRVDKQLLPKAAKSMLEVSPPPPAFTEVRSTPELTEIPQQPPSPPQSAGPEAPIEAPPSEPTEEPQSEQEPEAPPPPPAEEEKHETPKKRKESPRRSSLGGSPPARPIGTISPAAEEWEPPSWGSNLLEAKFLDDDIEGIAKEIEEIDQFFASPTFEFDPYKVSTGLAPTHAPAKILWTSPPPYALDDESPVLFGDEEQPSFFDSSMVEEMGTPPRWTSPASLPYRTPPYPHVTPPPPGKPTPPKKIVKKVGPKIKQTRASQLLQQKKEKDLAPPPPPPPPKKPVAKKSSSRISQKSSKTKIEAPPLEEEKEPKKVGKKPSKGKMVKKKPSKGKMPPAPIFSSPGEPFTGFVRDDVEEYLNQYNRTFEEIDQQYRRDLEEYRRKYAEAPFQKEASKAGPSGAKPKRLSRLARLTRPKLPKSHGAPVELEKSIHVSDDARKILEDIIEGQPDVIHTPQSRLKHPTPLLKHVPKSVQEEQLIQEEELSASSEEDELATMESQQGQHGKDPRLVAKFNEMMTNLMEQKKEKLANGESPSILQDYIKEQRSTMKRQIRPDTQKGQELLALLEREEQAGEKRKELFDEEPPEGMTMYREDIIEAEPADANTERTQLSAATILQAVPAEEDDFEELERQIEEEMLKSGEDPRAKTKRKMSRKEYDESKRRYLDVHHKADAQMEELEREDEVPLEMEEDFETLEKRIEEEMRRKGEDPHAKPKRKISRKEYEESRKRYLDVHRRADAQMEELEAAPDFQPPPRKRRPYKPPPTKRGRKPLSPLAEEDEEEWIGAEEFFRTGLQKPPERREIREKGAEFMFPKMDIAEYEELDEEMLPEELFEVDDDDVIDVDAETASPTKQKQMMDDIQRLYKEHYETLPAFSGVPVTTPRRTVMPERSPEAQGGPMADLVVITPLSPSEELDRVVKRRLQPWLPESPPVSEVERKPLPTLEDIETKYAPEHFKAEFESPDRQYQEVKIIPKVEEPEFSPRRKDWAFELEDIHSWLWGTPKPITPSIFDVPAERVYAESPPTKLGSPVSPILSPPIEIDPLKKQIYGESIKPDITPYRRKIGGKTVTRYSGRPRWATPIPEQQEPPPWMTIEDMDIREEIAKTPRLTERRPITFPLRSMKTLERRSAAPDLEPVRELYESPERKGPDIFDTTPTSEPIHAETPPHEFPDVIIEEVGPRRRFLETTTPVTRRPVGESPSGRKGPRRRTLRKRLKKRLLDFSTAPTSPDEEQVEVTDVETEIIETPPHVREYRKFSPRTVREALGLSPEKAPPTPPKREPTPERISPPPGSPRTPVFPKLAAEEFPQSGPLPEFSPPSPFSEWGVVEQTMEEVKKHEKVPVRRRKMKLPLYPDLRRLKDFYTTYPERKVETITEDPVEERAARIHDALEAEIEAEMEAAEAERIAEMSLLDRPVPEGLPSPMRPPVQVPFYETPPHLRLKPKTPPKKPIRIMPRTFMNVLDYEREPELYRSPSPYRSPVKTSPGLSFYRTPPQPFTSESPPQYLSPEVYEGSPGLLQEDIYKTPPSPTDKELDYFETMEQLYEEGNVLHVDPAPGPLPPTGIQLVAADAQRIEQLAAAQYAALMAETPPLTAAERVQQLADAQYAALLEETPPRRAATPPRRTATPPRREATPPRRQPSPQPPTTPTLKTPLRFETPTSELVKEYTLLPPTPPKPPYFEPQFRYDSQLPTSLLARLAFEEEEARAAQEAAAATAEVRGPEVVEFEYQETVKEQRPPKGVKSAGKVAKALKGKKIPSKPERKVSTRPERKVPSKPQKKVPPKKPEDEKKEVKKTRSLKSFKHVKSKLDTGRDRKKKEEKQEQPPPPLEFDYDIEALQELSVTPGDLQGLNLLDIDAEDMPELAPADSPERPFDPYWPRRWVRPSKGAAKLPPLAETEEEYRTSPLGFDMRWHLSPKRRVDLRAPEVKVLPELLKEHSLKFEEVHLDSPPRELYHHLMPVSKGEDLLYGRGLEAEGLPELTEEVDILDERHVSLTAEAAWDRIAKEERDYQIEEEGRPVGVFAETRTSPSPTRRQILVERRPPSPPLDHDYRDILDKEHVSARSEAAWERLAQEQEDYQLEREEHLPSDVVVLTMSPSPLKRKIPIDRSPPSPETLKGELKAHEFYDPESEEMTKHLYVGGKFVRLGRPQRPELSTVYEGTPPRRIIEEKTPEKAYENLARVMEIAGRQYEALLEDTPSPKPPSPSTHTPSPFRKARTPSPRRPSPLVSTPSPFRKARTPSPRRPSPLASTPSPFRKAATPPPKSPPPLYVEDSDNIDIWKERPPIEYYSPPSPIRVQSVDLGFDIGEEEAPGYYSPISEMEVDEYIDVWEGEEFAPDVSPPQYQSPAELVPDPEIRKMHPSPQAPKRFARSEYDPSYFEVHGLPQVEKQQLPPTPTKPKVPKDQRILPRRRIDFDQGPPPSPKTAIPLPPPPLRRRSSPERPSLFPPTPPAQPAQRVSPQVQPTPKRSPPKSPLHFSPRSVNVLEEESPDLLEVVSPILYPRVVSESPIYLNEVGPTVLEAVSPVSQLNDDEIMALMDIGTPTFQGLGSPIPEELAGFKWFSPKIIDFPGYQE